MAMIKIDGRSFSGDSLIVDGSGRVIVDGVEQPGALEGRVSITLDGQLSSFVCHAPATINGGVAGDVQANAPLTCGDVRGNVIGGVVTCGDVAGDVRANVLRPR